RAGLGGGAGALNLGDRHVRRGVLGRKHAAQGRAAIARMQQSNGEDVMNRRKFLQSTAKLGTGLGLALVAPPFVARAASKELLVAEPVHSTGYLPMYIAMANGYFAESDIVVKIVTIETRAGHTNAV